VVKVMVLRESGEPLWLDTSSRLAIEVNRLLTYYITKYCRLPIPPRSEADGGSRTHVLGRRGTGLMPEATATQARDIYNLVLVLSVCTKLAGRRREEGRKKEEGREEREREKKREKKREKRGEKKGERGEPRHMTRSQDPSIYEYIYSFSSFVHTLSSGQPSLNFARLFS
jgi:hypothetical protein